MKKTLIFQWFDCKDPIREQELVDCATHNIKLGFDEVVIFNDSVKPIFDGPQVKNIITQKRITYKNYIDYVADPENYGGLFVLTNTDIMLDKRILEVDKSIKENTLFALSRHEINGALPDMPACTQDVWVMISQPIHQSVIHQSDIPLGMPGCETRFSEIIFNIGFAVFNPCLEIKNIHIHSKGSTHSEANRIYGAYLFTPACTYEDIESGNPNILPIPHYLTSFTNRLFNIR